MKGRLWRVLVGQLGSGAAQGGVAHPRPRRLAAVSVSSSPMLTASRPGKMRAMSTPAGGHSASRAQARTREAHQAQEHMWVYSTLWAVPPSTAAACLPWSPG